MNRRDFLGGVAMASLSGCSPKVRRAATPPVLPPYDVLPKLMLIRAEVDRIFRVTVCLRPFRTAGPRLDAERVGDKTVVHNYGHGGSGWSLSWGRAVSLSRKRWRPVSGTWPSLDVARWG